MSFCQLRWLIFVILLMIFILIITLVACLNPFYVPKSLGWVLHNYVAFCINV